MGIPDEHAARVRLIEDVINSLIRAATVKALREIEVEARSDPARLPDLAPTITWLRVGIEELSRGS